jgi:hypothetical protein
LRQTFINNLKFYHHGKYFKSNSSTDPHRSHSGSYWGDVEKVIQGLILISSAAGFNRWLFLLLKGNMTQLGAKCSCIENGIKSPIRTIPPEILRNPYPRQLHLVQEPTVATMFTWWSLRFVLMLTH